MKKWCACTPQEKSAVGRIRVRGRVRVKVRVRPNPNPNPNPNPIPNPNPNQDTPTTGVSFYAMGESDPSKIGYIRDIPQPVGWKPLLDAATLLRPQLRRFGAAPLP